MRHYLLILLLGLGGACGGENEAGTGVSNPPSISALPSSQMASAAVGTTFLDSSSAWLNILNLFVKSAVAQNCSNDPGCICDQASRSKIDSFGIQTIGFKPAGTYGSIHTTLTLAGEAFCTLPDGTSNTGNGPDGRGRFAGFTFTRGIHGSCSNTSGQARIEIRKGSEGIFRHTRVTVGEVTHQPEIYGRFTLAFGATEATVNCTIFIGANHEMLLADCDAEGEILIQDLNATCQF